MLPIALLSGPVFRQIVRGVLGIEKDISIKEKRKRYIQGVKN